MISDATSPADQSPQIIPGTKRVRRNRILSETPEAKERRLAAAREYVRANRDRVAAYKARWAEDNAEKVSEFQRRYYADNGEIIRQRANNWRAANIDRKRSANKAWARANPDKARQSGRLSKQRRRGDPAVRLLKSMSEQIRLSQRGRKDGASWEVLLGYTRQQLVRHIERQLCVGMAWSNYGEWHIDHIVPASSFVFDSPYHPEFRACWSLTNLRPLWAPENLSKKDKRLFLI